jgi:fibronectin type 3 domain-containing protein
MLVNVPGSGLIINQAIDRWLSVANPIISSWQKDASLNNQSVFTSVIHIVSDSSWRVSSINGLGWNNINFNDSDWEFTVSPAPVNCGWVTCPNKSDIYTMWSSVQYRRIYLRKTFFLADSSTVISATIETGCDDDQNVYINGVLVASDWNGISGPYLITDIEAYLQPGENVIALEAYDIGGCRWMCVNAIITLEMPSSYSITGNTGEGRVSLVYLDWIVKVATSDDLGNYTIPVSAGWSGTVTPSKIGYTFEPPSLPYANVQSPQTEQNYTAKTQPPPLVIVHGILFKPGQNGDSCSAIEPLNNSNSSMGKLPKWFEDTGKFEVYIAHLQTSPLLTPPLEWNAACLRKQLLDVHSKNPQDMTIIAHSMGGLVSRAAIQGLPLKVKIKELYTLGSPHAGVPEEAINILFPLYGPIALKSYCLIQPAVCQFSVIYMTYFNSLNPNNPNGRDIKYYFIGGDGSGSSTLPKWKSIVDRFSGPNDGGVGKYSAVGWFLNNKTFFPPSWPTNGPPGQYWTNEVHLTDWGNSYFDQIPGSIDPHSHAYDCILSLIDGKPLSNCTDAKDPGATSADFTAGSTASLSAFTDMHEGHLDVGQSVSIPVEIDTVLSSLFYLGWSGVAPAFTLTRPDSQLIDPAYASGHPEEVGYESFAGSSEISPYADYAFPSTQPGTWQLNLTATGAVDYRVFAALDSGRTLTAQMNADTYQIGDVSTITANLQSSEVGLTGAMVTASIKRADEVVDTVALTDMGNGVYSNNYTIPDAPGFLNIDVTATGDDGGTTFTRQTHLIASVKDNNLQLTGTYGELPNDDNGDGVYEKLNFTVEVNSASPAEYELSADLKAGELLIAHSQDSFNLVSGLQTITLPFEGDLLRKGGLDGPFTITNLVFTPLDSGIPEKTADNVLTTSAYGYLQFGSQASFLISGNSGVAGASLAYTDGTPKTASADEGGNYSFSVSYNWSGRVTPSLPGYIFSPASLDYVNVQSVQTGQNYTAVIVIPVNLQASDGTYTDKVLLTWDAVSGATTYDVYRATSSGDTKTLLGSPISPTFDDTSATPGVTYYYWVKTCVDANCSDFSLPDAGWRNLSAPLNLQASDGFYTDKVLLTWTASEGATTYNIYRATTWGGAKTLLGSPSSTTYDDTSATPGVTYYYWVKACKDTSCSAFSTPNTGWRKLSAPLNLQASDGTTTDKVSLTWTASSGATSYNVYRATSWGGAKTLLGSPNSTTFDDITATPGVTYYYWVKACLGTHCSAYTTPNTGWRMLSAPLNLQASDGTATDKVSLTWTSSSGATSYNVYRADSWGGTRSLLGSPTVASFADTSATPGVTYYYWVKACRGTRCSVNSILNTGWRALAAPANLQASDGTFTTKVQLTWTASTGTTFYKVYRATSAGGTKVLLSSPTALAYADLTATPGVTYYYWVKACRSTRCSVFSISNTGWRKP